MSDAELKLREVFLGCHSFVPFNDKTIIVIAMEEYAEESCKIKQIEIDKLKDELLEASGLKNRDQYQNELTRSYQKGKN